MHFTHLALSLAGQDIEFFFPIDTVFKFYSYLCHTMLAKLTKTAPERIVQVMNIYQSYDPYLVREQVPRDELAEACRRIWQQYGNDTPEKLAAYATQLREYYK